MKSILISMALIGVALGASASELNNAPAGAAVTQLQGAAPSGVDDNIQAPTQPEAGEEPVNSLPTELEISDVVAAQ